MLHREDLSTPPVLFGLQERSPRACEQTERTLELGAAVRRNLARAANEDLIARQARIRRLFDDLIPAQIETGLPCDNQMLARISRPVVEVRQFANWCNSSPDPVAAEELEALRKLPLAPIFHRPIGSWRLEFR